MRHELELGEGDQARGDDETGAVLGRDLGEVSKKVAPRKRIEAARGRLLSSGGRSWNRASTR
jgi:hypothetical protein